MSVEDENEEPPKLFEEIKAKKPSTKQIYDFYKAKDPTKNIIEGISQSQRERIPQRG